MKTRILLIGLILTALFLSDCDFGISDDLDLELGNMEKELPDKIENLCFESIIENDELSFDYKLNRGIAKNKNATFLMRKMEIVPDFRKVGE